MVRVEVGIEIEVGGEVGDVGIPGFKADVKGAEIDKDVRDEGTFARLGDR